MPDESPFGRIATRRISRRTLCAALLTSGAGTMLLARSGGARAAADAPRTLTLHNTHTLESLTVEHTRAGQYDDAALAAVNRVLRDHRTGAVHVIDPGLLELLADAAQQLGRVPEFEVISGYRSPETNAAMHARSNGVAARSLHVEGRAIDVRLVGCDIGRLRDAGIALARGGVGYYETSQFVHLDTGRVRTWAG